MAATAPRTLTINPVTRLEGHARINMFLDEAGMLADCYVVVPELRGFERFLVGRPIEEVLRITPRICGVCPEAHHAASAKAADAVYGLRIPPTAELIRRLQYNAFVAGDHATHFFALGGPDFILGPDAPAATRNVFGVIDKVGAELAGLVLRMRREAHEVAEMLGGRRVSPVGMIPGGQSKAVTPAMQQRLVQIGDFMVEFSKRSLQVFADVVLSDGACVDLIRSEAFTHRTYYMALVNDRGQVDHYDGQVRVVGPDGAELCRYAPAEYLDHVAEHLEPWTYVKLPYLKRVGWRGFVDGPESGVYRSGPLGMINAAQAMQTPLAEAERERFFATLGPGPVHATLATHWARLIEMVQASELVARHAGDERLTDPDVRVLPSATPHEGVGVVQAPRGLLTHHFVTDEQGLVRRANLIVGTTNSYAAIQMSVKKAAAALIDGRRDPGPGVFNRIEMALRAYDPCFGCATHALPGEMPLELRFFGPGGEPLTTLRREVPA